MSRRAVIQIQPAERVARARSRLRDLTTGSEERLALLRDADKNPDLEMRQELAYLVQLIERAALRCVEVCVAGKPGGTRRVFAKVTHTPEHDGTVLDLYTGQRRAAPWAIPSTEEARPARTRAPRVKEPAHV